jgi:hypothetical protein
MISNTSKFLYHSMGLRARLIKRSRYGKNDYYHVFCKDAPLIGVWFTYASSEDQHCKNISRGQAYSASLFSGFKFSSCILHSAFTKGFVRSDVRLPSRILLSRRRFTNPVLSRFLGTRAFDTFFLFQITALMDVHASQGRVYVCFLTFDVYFLLGSKLLWRRKRITWCFKRLWHSESLMPLCCTRAIRDTS